MIYTSTALRRYCRCPAYYYYENELCADKEKAPLFFQPSNALLLGQAIHDGLAAMLNGEDYSKVLRQSEYNEDIIQHAIVLLEGKDFAEQQQLLPTLDKVIEIEKELSVTAGSTIYAGKCDAIADYNGKLWIVEHKSSSFHLKQPEKYEKAIQSNMYIHMARENGYDVGGILINYIKTVGLQQRLKRQPETKQEYWERASNHVSDNLAEYFTFLEIPRSEAEVASIMADIGEIVSHINYCRDRNYFHRAPDACNEYRRWCEFGDVCTGKYNEKLLSIRESPHPELNSGFLKSITKAKAKDKLRTDFSSPF